MKYQILYKVSILLLLCAIIFILLLPSANATLSKSDKKKKQKTKELDLSKGNVKARGLVTEKVKVNDILKEHHHYCELEREVRHFKGQALAYVTPWNSHGYDIAKLFHKKFTLVSPVWLQVKPKNGKCTISGSHDIDNGWAAEVTKGGDNSLVPRILLEGWTALDLRNLFASEDAMMKCTKVVSSFIKKHNFGGITIEIWSQVSSALHNDVTHFLVHLADELHKESKLLILVIPPDPVLSGAAQAKFTAYNFDQLKSSVDYFSIMTYDYHAQVGAAAPLSPVEWIERSIRKISPIDSSTDRAKILLGIHFYGMKFAELSGSRPIIGHEYISILKNYRPQIRWEAEDAEHSTIYTEGPSGENVFMFYPSLKFLQSRLDLATKLGTGIAIWEIGQGLDYFYDLL